MFHTLCGWKKRKNGNLALVQTGSASAWLVAGRGDGSHGVVGCLAISGYLRWEESLSPGGTGDLSRGGLIRLTHAVYSKTEESSFGARGNSPGGNGAISMLPTAKRLLLRSLGFSRDGRAAKGLLAFWRGSAARLSLGSFRFEVDLGIHLVARPESGVGSLFNDTNLFFRYIFLCQLT